MNNRINPYGSIIDTKARGAWMGNRGLLHNDARQIVRPYKLKAWITCRLAFKGWHRQIMQPNRYTELFFLDEATAFAAGHRPCAECRRPDFNRFKELWLKGNACHQLSASTSIRSVDAILHEDRMTADGRKNMYKADLHDLPDGTFISINDNPYLIAGNHLHLWTPAGYSNPASLPRKMEVDVLTPLSIVQTLRAGYLPQMNL